MLACRHSLKNILHTTSQTQSKILTSGPAHISSNLSRASSAMASTNPLEKMLAYNAKWASQSDTQDAVRSTATSQKPKVLWLGCADSRIPEALLTGVKPGECFVHRNIANCFQPGDVSATSVLAYAIENLGVEHVVVVGHYGCGGVIAAMASAKDRVAAKYADQNATNGATDYLKSPAEDEGPAAITRWLAPLRSLAVAQLRSAEQSATQLSDEEAHRQLVRSHCCAQVSNIESSSIVRKAANAGRPITVDGWVYDVANGRLVDLKV